MLRRSIVLLALAAGLPATASAQQDHPKIVAKTFDQDSVLAALKAECPASQFSFVKADKHGAVFIRDEGTVLVSGRQVPLQREVTFHFEKAKTGTRVVATEELVLHPPGGGEDRQTPDQFHLANDLQDLLNRVKTAVGPGTGKATDSTAAAQ